jgi:cytochrome c553
MPCISCHGPDLRGFGDAPHLVGRSPMYLFRQLNDIKIGARAGANAELMQPVVAKLSQDDMLSIVAYLAAQSP